MNNLTVQQKRKLERLGRVVDEGDTAILDYLFELEEKIDETINEVDSKVEELKATVEPNLKNILENVKGKDGKTPVPGVDFPIPENGKDGNDYILTEQDKVEIASKVKIPTVEKIIEKTETIIKEPTVTEIKKETFIESKETGKSIIDKINGLDSEGDELKIDASHIKNLPKSDAQSSKQHPMLHPTALGNLPDVSVVGVQVGQTIVWNGTYWENSSAGLTILESTEIPDSVQTIFTFTNATSQPNFLLVDYAMKPAVAKNGYVNWTWDNALKQATLQTPAQEDIRAIK